MFYGDTSAYLAQPPGAPTTDLLTMVSEELRAAVCLALHRAATEKKPAVARGGILETSEGRFRLEVAVAPLDDELAPGHSLVSFRRHEEALAPASVTEQESSDVRELQTELMRTREELQSAIEELQSSNEEMKASNEEAMSVNEELQSTNEELQTSKEELQSLNEELATVNVQLQNKMEELEATANDLSSLLSSTDIAVIFLDTKMRIRRYTPAVKDLLELIPSDVGRPLSDLAKKFEDGDLSADCQAVLEKLIPIERDVHSASGRDYLRRVMPYRTTDDRITGVVITFVDITSVKAAEDALRRSEERFRLVLEGAPDFAMILCDPQGTIITWNVGAERMLGPRGDRKEHRHDLSVGECDGPDAARDDARRRVRSGDGRVVACAEERRPAVGQRRPHGRPRRPRRADRLRQSTSRRNGPQTGRN